MQPQCDGATSSDDSPSLRASTPQVVSETANGIMASLSRWQRRRAEKVIRLSYNTLADVPPDALNAVMHALIARNAWLVPLPGRMSKRALAHDLRVLETQIAALKNGKFVHESILTAGLPAPDGRDRRRIWLAFAAQVAGAVVSVVFRHDSEWVLLTQSTALICSTACVSECEHVDARRWARFMTGAVSLNALLTFLVLMSRPHP